MQIDMQNLFQLLQFHNTNNIFKSVSIDLTAPLFDDEKVHLLPIHVQKIYNQIFAPGENKIDLFESLPFKRKKTKTPVCNKQFQKGQSAFRCFQCTTHPNAVICLKCFENGEHSSHRFSKMQTGGGNCDCGNTAAIKSEGFCKNHTGYNCQIPEIQPKQEALFIEYFLYIFQWFSLLAFKEQKKSNTLAQIIFSYLQKINQQSLYYNVITYHLLLTELPKQNKKIIDFLFTLDKNAHIHSMKAIVNLYYNMFGLEQFKMSIMKSFLNAYNRIEGFQKTQFHSLYIQLFANHNLVIGLVQKQKLVIKPQKKYDIRRIINDLSFITTIQKKAAVCYFKQYFRQNQVIPLPFMDTIQQKLENKNNQSMHVVDLVTKYINQQNIFMITMIEILELIQSGQPSYINCIIQNTYDFIHENKPKYSYNINKAVLPYHRLFTSLLFLHYEGDISYMSNIMKLEQFCDILKTSPQQFLTLISKNLKETLGCLFQFAETFAKRSYFDNYLPLYVMSGKRVINCDFMLVKQSLTLFQKQTIKKLKLDQIIIEMLENSKKSGNINVEQLLQKWIAFSELLLEAIVSKTPEILENNALSLKNVKLQLQKKQMLKRLLKLFGPLTREEIKPLEKHFVSVISDEIIQQLTVFNKQTRKYTLISPHEVNSLDISYYPSKMKSSTPEFDKIKPLPKVIPPNIDTFELVGLIQIFNNQFLQIIASQIQQQFHKIKNFEMIHRDFARLIAKLFAVIKQKIQSLKTSEEMIQSYQQIMQKCLQLKNKLQKLSGHLQLIVNQQQKIGLPNNKDLQAVNKKQLMQKNRLKKQKLLNKFKNHTKKVLEDNKTTLAKVEQEEQQFQNKINKQIQMKQEENVCMICRDSSSKDSLCYLAAFTTTNKLNSRLNIKENLYNFKSCLHASHYSCCFNIFGQLQIFKCPLCRAQGNIMLPAFETTDKQSLNKMFHRIDFIANTRKSFPQLIKVKLPKIQNVNVFWNLLKSSAQYVGTDGLLNSTNFQKSNYLLSNTLYFAIKRFWNNSLDGDGQQKFHKIMMDYISYHRQLMQNMTTDEITLCEIKLCCIEALYQSLMHDFSPEYMRQRYFLRISQKDLKQIVRNLSLVIVPQEKLGLIAKKQQQMEEQQSKIKDLSEIFRKYYSPPLKCSQFFSFRKQHSKFCKSGHNVLMCIECQDMHCQECKKTEKHASSAHSQEALFFSCLNGSLFYFGQFKKLKTPSLYENNIGNTWTVEKSPDLFMLNEELYHQIVEQYFKQNICKFLKDRMGNLVEVLAANPHLNFIEVD